MIFIVAAQSCFTGIESTPTISDSDVRKQRIELTAEDTYLESVKPESLVEYHPGKTWIVLDSRIGKVMFNRGVGLSANHGDTITLQGYNEVTSVTGEPQTEFYFLGPDGQEVSYRASQSVSQLSTAGHIDIPFAVETSVIEQTSKLLTGNDYYIITPSRYDLEGNNFRGRKFVKVHIDSVGAGNDFYPVALYLSDGNDHFKLFMSVLPGSSMPRKFASLLSLSDPRSKYQSITDSNWQNIINGRVAEGMTRDECRLSLGAPTTVERYPGYSLLREMWSYEDGKYLIFDDGILTSFRQ